MDWFTLDWFKRFFSEPKTLIAFFSSAFIGLVVGIANGVIQKKHGGWSGFFVAIGTGVVIALIVGLGIQDYIKSESVRIAIVAVCAVISDDIFTGLKTFGRGLRTDPLGSIARLIDALRGRSSASVVPPANDQGGSPRYNGPVADEESFRGPAR